MDIACGTSLHRHPPAPRTCEGCGLKVCGPDDGFMTRAGRRYVCDPCLERHRRQWMKAEARA